MTERSNALERRVLVFTPTGRDSALTADALAKAGVEAHVCSSATELSAEIERGMGAALLAEEVLTEEAFVELAAALERQPPWSDPPLLVFTSDEAGAERLLAAVAARANVTILQRPTRIAMLLSVVRAALRSRERQYDTRGLLERLREADRQKDAFLATISHELRTPLNAIVGWTTMMGLEPCASASHRQGLEVVGRNARAQARIVDDLLDMSRIISGKVRLDTRLVDLREVVAAALESVQPAAAARQIAVEAPASGRPVLVNGDPDRLQQIAWNLLSNAVKFTPKGGSVEAEIGQGDGVAFLRVSDTGRGIEPEFLPYVFDRFRQSDDSTTRRHGGLGLGLAIVRHIVELHGGSIRAESGGVGRGATFVATLPLAGGAAAGGPPPETWTDGEAHLSGPPPLKGLRVLVVDDNADAVEVMLLLLQRLGAEVRGACSAEAGLSEVRAWRPDVLVSDIGMPDHDGYWLIERVRSLPPEEGGDTPAVALTALASLDERTHALLSGFQRHLRKPVSLGDLASTVAGLVGRD